MADLSSEFVGIKSPNPFWLASAPPTDKEYNVRRAFEAGRGGVVWKTLGEDGPKTRYAVGPGFLEVTAAGEVKILVERAVLGSEIDVEAAEAERDETEPTVKSGKGGLDAEFKNLKARYDWALAQLGAHELSR